MVASDCLISNSLIKSPMKIKPNKKIGVAMLRDYNKKLIKNNAMYLTHYSHPLLSNDIVILDAQLDLSLYVPVTKLSKLLKSKGDLEIELRPNQIDTNGSRLFLLKSKSS
jgi:hypothetical protein